MKSISANQVAYVMAILLIVVAGCSRIAEETPSESETSKAIASYVRCVGRFTGYNPKFTWSENWTDDNGFAVHDDGRAPRVVFHISSPAEFANRVVGILYKYGGKDALSPPSLSQKGKTFSFDVPADFLVGKFETIDNMQVRNFWAMP